MTTNSHRLQPAALLTAATLILALLAAVPHAHASTI